MPTGRAVQPSQELCFKKIRVRVLNVTSIPRPPFRPIQRTQAQLAQRLYQHQSHGVLREPARLFLGRVQLKPISLSLVRRRLQILRIPINRFFPRESIPREARKIWNKQINFLLIRETAIPHEARQKFYKMLFPVKKKYVYLFIIISRSSSAHLGDGGTVKSVSVARALSIRNIMGNPP